METFKMTPVMIVAMVFAQILFSTIQEAEGQGVAMQDNPSFHRISFRVGPDGRPNMGSHGQELDQFFGGSSSSRNRASRNGVGGMFMPRIFRGRRPRRFWRSFRF